MTLSEQELTAMKERAEKATAGPWEGFKKVYRDKDLWIVGPANDAAIDGNKHFFGPVNQDFCIHARTDVPALVDDLLKARHLLEAAAGIIESKFGPEWADEIRAFLGAGDEAET
jgi:hypothetical protein